jgi:hypothetical protein
VLDDLVGARVQQSLLELGGDLVAVVGVDETKRKERTSLGVGRRRRRLIIINTIEEFELVPSSTTEPANKGHGYCGGGWPTCWGR